MKKNRRFIAPGIAFFFLFNTVIAQTDLIGTDFKLPAHPRILLLNGEESKIMSTISRDKVWQNMQNIIIAECRSLIDKPPVQRIQIGRRLLDKSREALRRIFMLSYAWRMTKDAEFFKVPKVIKK